MAVITKIREKSWLLIGFVGLAMIAFILSDYKKLLGGSEGEFGMGSVDGEKVKPEVYTAKIQDFQQLQLLQVMQQYNLTMEQINSDPNLQAQLQQMFSSPDFIQQNEDAAFESVTDSLMYQKAFDALKITLSDKELKQIKTESKKQGFNSPDFFIQQQKVSRYNALISLGMYVTNVEAEEEYRSQRESKSVEFVVRRFSEVNDAEVKMTDAELKSYYEQHKRERKYWNRTANRELKMVEIMVNPSGADTAEFNTLVARLRSEFTATKNDSTFIMSNSDIKRYNAGALGTAVPEGHPKAKQFMTYPMDFDTVFKRASIGQLIGPYRMGEFQCISKVRGFTPSKFKVRHILLATNQSKDAKILANKKKTADSLMALVSAANFAELAKKHSDDPGSKEKGGEYTDFLEGELAKEFGAYCANAPIGKIGLIKTDFGYHIVEVLERDASKFPILSTLAKSFKPSKKTISDMDVQVSDFLSQLESTVYATSDISERNARFDTLCRKNNYFVRPVMLEDNKAMVYGIESKTVEERLLELAYREGAAAGDIVASPIKAKNKYYIAMLSAIHEKGEPKFEEVKDRMKKDAMDEKKAKRLMNQMLKVKDMKQLAAQGNTTVERAEITFANPSVGNVGYEPELVGSLFQKGLKDGQTTLPLIGRTGVYVFQVISTKKAPVAANYKEEKARLTKMMTDNLASTLPKAMRKSHNVIDNRRLYPNIRP